MINQSKADLFMANYKAGTLTAPDLAFAVSLAVEYIEERNSGLPQPTLQRSAQDTNMFTDPKPPTHWNNMLTPDERVVLFQATESLYERSASDNDRQLPSQFKAVLAIAKTRIGVYAVLVERRPLGYKGYCFIRVDQSVEPVTLIACQWDENLNATTAEDYLGKTYNLDLQNVKWL